MSFRAVTPSAVEGAVEKSLGSQKSERKELNWMFTYHSVRLLIARLMYGQGAAAFEIIRKISVNLKYLKKEIIHIFGINPTNEF
jgi:hypothetical protein